MLKQFLKSHRDSILTIQIYYVRQEGMCKKTFRTIITILILPGLFIGIVNFSSLAFASLFPGNSPPEPSFQKTCDMDHCNPNLPKCPLCPSSGSISLVLHLEGGFYLPILASSMLSIFHDSLSDQGFVKSIFHPPTTIL